jgi:hypothetical protein
MIQTQYQPDSYAGNNIADTFAFNWPILAKSDLVAKTKVVATGVVAILILDIDYTIDDLDVGIAANGGDVVLTNPLATGTNLYLLRRTPLVQLDQIKEAGVFPAAMVMEMADRLTMMIQEADWRLRTALKFADTSDFFDIDVPDPQDNYYLGWLNNLLINTSLGQLGNSVTVTGSATFTDITFAAALPDTDYQIVSLVTSWNTTTSFANKTVNGFRVNYGTAAPGGGGTLVWRVNP